MFGDLWPDVPGRRGADQVGHQRRARPHLDVARDRRPAHPLRPARVARGRRRAPGPGSPRPPTTRCGGPASRAASGWWRSCGAGCASRALARGASASSVAWADEALDPRVLTIGFARRFATYKRANLLLSQPDRLQGAAAVGRPAGAVRVRRQGPPGRRGRQGDDPPDRRVRRRPRRPPPLRVRRRLRHRRGPRPLPGRRRVAEQPPPAPGGVRHVGHEGGAQRRPQPVDPRRLVGRDVRRRERLGHLVGRGRRRPRPARPARGQLPVRPARAPGRAAVLRPRRGDPVPRRWVAQGQARRSPSLGPQVSAVRMVARLRRGALRAHRRPGRRAGGRRLRPGPGAGGVEGAGARRRGTRSTSTWTEADVDRGRAGRRADGRGASVALGDLSPDDVDVQLLHGPVGQNDELARPRDGLDAPRRRRRRRTTPATRAPSPPTRPAATASPSGSSPATPTSSPPPSSASSPGRDPLRTFDLPEARSGDRPASEVRPSAAA